MLTRLLRAIRNACQRALERLDPVAETPTLPPPAAREWYHAELEAQPDLAGVDRVLARWQSEGLPAETAEMQRSLEIARRVWSDRRLTSWRGGQA